MAREYPVDSQWREVEYADYRGNDEDNRRYVDAGHRNSAYSILIPRRRDTVTTVLSVSPGAVVTSTSPSRTIEILARSRSRSRPAASREQSLDHDHRARSPGQHDQYRRESSGLRSRSERFLSVPGPVTMERTRSAGSMPAGSMPGGSMPAPSRSASISPTRLRSRQSSRQRSRQSRHDDDDDDDDDDGDDDGDDFSSRMSIPPVVMTLPGSVIREFQYRPLDPAVKQAIRVLRVRPDLVTVDDEGLIACELEHTSISTAASYSTVSYAWGDPDDPTRRILVDGCLFSVRRNLHQVLRHLRRFHAGRAVWIDAIAINQHDVDEKSGQVQMMSAIYAGTAEVFVWLGPRVEHVGHAIRSMRAFYAMSDVAVAARISHDAAFWRGFGAINRSPYWRRVWVVQEFVTPRAGRIIQGDDWVDLARFQQAIRVFDARIWRYGLRHAAFWGHRAADDEYAAYMSNIHPLWQRRSKWAAAQVGGGGGGRGRVVDADWALLSGTRYCQDIRDRVYGIMPLATNGASLRVDYRLNAFEVLLESIWLEHNSHLDRTDVLMNLANMLMLTPASICLYAQRKTKLAGVHLRRTRLDALSRRRAEHMHLQAAASADCGRAWIDAASDGAEAAIRWRNFAVDQLLRLPRHALTFPRCSWNMFVYTAASHSGSVGLKLAVDDSTTSQKMTDDEFIHANRKKAMALGVYRTTCSPYPLTIYYALTDRLEDTRRRGGGNTAALFGSALQGLDDLDLDL